MTGKVFIDTNVLVYLFSSVELEKRDHCMKLLSPINNKYSLVWSTQVVQEFYNVMTVKFKKSPSVVKSALQSFAHFELIVNNFNTIESAIDIQILNKFSFWDSLIISSAVQAKCSTILTEDLSNQQNVSGIIIQNPFEMPF